jgi:fructose-specific phosphotransferase system component IIB
MTNSISNKDVAKAKQILKDARSDSGSANSISNKDIEIAKMILRGEENNSDGDGFRNGGKVSLGRFKGNF